MCQAQLVAAEDTKVGVTRENINPVVSRPSPTSPHTQSFAPLSPCCVERTEVSPKQEAGGAGWIHMAKTECSWPKMWKDPEGEWVAKQENRD